MLFPNRNRFIAACVVLMSSVATGLFAQDPPTATGSTVITTAVPFLTICPDSRSGALGEAGVAVADNANALFWNPSALAFSPHKFGMNVNYTPWLRGLGIPDINHAFLPFYYNLGERAGVAGFSMTYFSLGDINFTNNLGIQTGTGSAYEMAFAGYYSRQISSRFAMGTAFRFIYSDLSLALQNGAAASSFAADINGMYKTTTRVGGRDLGINVGFNLSNIGAKMTYDPSKPNRDFIPTNLRLGYALRYFINEYNSVTFTNDFSKLMVPSEGGTSDKNLLEGMFSSFGDAKGGLAEEMREVIVSVGLEYWYNNLFAARVGYFNEAEDKGARKFATVGLGVKFKMFTLDFAYLAPFTQNHPLQNTLRFSLGVNIGEVNYSN
jgi:hypothetical protein